MLLNAAPRQGNSFSRGQCEFHGCARLLKQDPGIALVIALSHFERVRNEAFRDRGAGLNDRTRDELGIGARANLA